MNNDFLSVLEYLENDRQIARETLIEVIEESLLMAARKAVGPAHDLRVKINPETGDINAWAKLQVVERVTEPECEIALDEVHRKQPEAEVGDLVEWEVTPENFGRIAAQTAKQVIMQKLRLVERVRVCKEFADRIGELVSGVVSRNERGDLLVNLSHAEAVMPYAERIPGEEYQVGDHFTGLLLRINEDQPGPSLVLSRGRPEFVQRLFEREVTEIAEGLVQIKAVAREAGYRSKVAVMSKDSSVDPVGACVGLRGNRVKSIVRELAGEKVDIILWSAKIHEFVANALQPAKLSRVKIIEDEHLLQVDVPEEQLSLAIGKRGQNARLAAKLTGWRIDIQKLRSDEEVEFESKVKQAVDALVEALAVERDVANSLVASGFVTVEGVAAADVGDLSAIKGIDDEQAAAMLERARKRLGD